ncbi:glycosyltransferase [Terracidiphilus gabretensis]|jgi:glycosyltransferase involved in cell wall biosynthesis|uniref:glycosyltransferase n=1 Tax=Terracidiphilus gabretensis TaxID=1577687 RepID=UPI00071B86F2|nr:glycosyltransferase [Terracidiphilus gabretensis]
MTIHRTVLFLIPHLGGGGAERVTANLVCGLPEGRFRVHLGLVTGLAAQAIDGVEKLPPNVMVHALGATRVRSAMWPLLRLVWRLKPDLIFSNMFHVNFLVLLLRPFFPRRTRCIIRQNQMTSAETGTGDFTRRLYRALYPRADKVVCQSEAMAKEMRVLIGTAENLRVLPNPVLPNSAPEGGKSFAPVCENLWRDSGPRFLAMGRLTHQKGFDMLLPAFQQVLRSYPTAELAILGQGPEDAALKTMSRELGIEEHVHFAGYVTNPQAWFAGATAFIMSSRHEGISNALLEAAAAGLPIVTTPALGGIAELLTGQPGAWITREISTQAIVESLIFALESIAPGERFSHLWLQDYRMENAIPRFESLINEVLAGTHA